MLFSIKNFDKLKGEPYNVGLNDANLSKAELADAIKKQVPNLYVHYAEVGTDPYNATTSSPTKKSCAKGFAAKRLMQEGIRQLIQLYSMLPRSVFKNV